jgi:hypothetical protein
VHASAIMSDIGPGTLMDPPYSVDAGIVRRLAKSNTYHPAHRINRPWPLFGALIRCEEPPERIVKALS